MTKSEMYMVEVVMQYLWREAYEAGLFGLYPPDRGAKVEDQWKDNHKARDKRIKVLIEAAGLKSDVEDNISNLVINSTNHIHDESIKIKMAEIWVEEKSNAEKMAALFGFGYGVAMCDIIDTMGLYKDFKDKVKSELREKE